MTEPHPVTGYILAGGRSSRMGTDKSLLPLAGKPLIQHAIGKLHTLCPHTFILSSRPDLAAYAPLVPDLHPGCGPLGGIEAALLHTSTPWNLFLAVDMPFISAAFLTGWLTRVLPQETTRIALFTVDGIPQPTLCLLHRDATPFVQAAVERGQYRVLAVLEQAAHAIAHRNSLPLDSVLSQQAIPGDTLFLNLNTPEDFAAAEAHALRLHPITEIPEETHHGG